MRYHAWLRFRFGLDDSRRVRTRRVLRVEALEARHLLHGGLGFPAAGGGEGEASPMPDFSLADVNPSSPTSAEAVSPRDYLQQVSAWYFGHAT